MTKFFDSNNPNVIEAVMVVGDQYAVRMDPIPPPFDAPPWDALVPESYSRGALFYLIGYDQPVLHTDYSVGDAQSNPNFQRSYIRVEDWLADLCYDEQVAIDVLGSPVIVTIPGSALDDKPEDWPDPINPLMKARA